MPYKLLKISLLKLSNHTKADEVKPYTLEIAEAEPAYLRYSSTKEVYLEVYPELMSEYKHIEAFKNDVSKYLRANKVVYSVDFLLKDYLDFLLENNCFRNKKKVILDWDRHNPSIERSPSLFEILLKSNELQVDLPVATLTVKVDDLHLFLKADTTLIQSYLDNSDTMYKVQRRSKALCGLSSFLTTTNLAPCVAQIQISTKVSLPSWQKKLLLRKHDRLSFLISFNVYGELARIDKYPKRQIGKTIFASFLMNENITLSPISFPMFSIAELKYILAKHKELTLLRYSLIGLGGIAKDMRNLVGAAKLNNHSTGSIYAY